MKSTLAILCIFSVFLCVSAGQMHSGPQSHSPRIRRACRRRQLTSPSISNARVAANAQGQDQGGFGATSQVSAGFGVASASGASGGVSARPSASVSASGGASSRVSATTSAAETTQSGTAAGGARNAAANGRGRGSGAGTGNANANANGTSIGTGTGRGNGNGNAQAGNGNTGDIETSTTLDPAVIQAGSAQNGNPTDGQVASLTSTNNFINFCATKEALGAPLMNGTQTKAQQACNPIPMGMIVSQNNMPSCKFVSPKNLDTIKANADFTIQMKIKNMVSGNFVNPATNYFSAPSQIGSNGQIIGHSHFVVEAIDSLTSTTVTNPLQFAFFKGVDPAAVNGVMSVDVPGGLPAGTYRLASINTAANHQPVLVTIAQHGTLDDMIYFTAK